MWTQWVNPSDCSRMEKDVSLSREFSASDAQVAIKEVKGRKALYLFGYAVGGLGYGERLEPTSIAEAWMDRCGQLTR